MAEVAHVTDAASGRPSLFELIAADGLFSSLHPAVRHVCKVIVSRYPGSKFLLDRHFDELFLLVNAFIQRHYLYTYAGSLAENFYGIKRAPLDGGGADSSLRLSPRDVYRSIFWLCGFPYVRTKLDSLFEDLEHQHASGILPEEPWRRRIHWVFLRLYPVLHAVFSLCAAFYFLGYMFDLSRHHSPLTRLAGVQLAYVTSQDWQVIQERHEKLTSWSRLRQLGLPSAVVLFGLHASTRLLRHTLEVGSFFVQFLEWWGRAEDRGSRRIGQAEVPPPPPQLLAKPNAGGERTCPLCLRRRKGEAVLAISGHVFCHVCIFRYVSEKGRCPITRYPATTDQICRLFPPDS